MGTIFPILERNLGTIWSKVSEPRLNEYQRGGVTFMIGVGEGLDHLVSVAEMLLAATLHVHAYSVAPPPPIRVLLQTDRFAVVAKPPGCIVHRNKHMRDGEVPLLQRVRDQLGRHVHAVHRLDGGTSGCVLFAFDSVTTAMLQAAMTSETAHKQYYAHVRGDASWLKDYVVDRAIKSERGIRKDARTHLHCVASCSDDLPERSSLIVATPSTGRWHVRIYSGLFRTCASLARSAGGAHSPWNGCRNALARSKFAST